MTNDVDTALDLSAVLAARNRISTLAKKTPLKPSFSLSRRLEKNIFLKLENMQDTGAFKLRGAANRILSLPVDAQQPGVVTTSSGNHGRAVAYVAQCLGIRAVICLTEIVPEAKVAGIKEFGAEVVVHGQDQNEATVRAHELEQEQGLTFISAFDDPYIIAGQGTIGLEIFEDLPDIDTLLVPLSGGGLMSGVALAARTIKPEVKIIGVTCIDGAAMYESIKAGHIVYVDEKPSVADALPGPIPEDNQYTFKMCRDLVDDIVQVAEQQIAEAMIYALDNEKILFEGAGAVGIAHLLAQDSGMTGDNIAVVCSGNNISMEKMQKIIEEYGRNTA